MNYHKAYILLLLASGFLLFLCLPVVKLDTDLWYHLSGGRYILMNGSLPYDSFFSFISPPRPWVDYYWLFQIIVYKIYSVSEYYGLIILRAIAYAATLSVLFLFMHRGKKEDMRAYYFVVLFVAYFLLLQARFLNIRPHMFSYLFMAVFLYVLEFEKKRAIYILPLLTVLWTNIHGIMYPVILLMVFSYVAESAFGTVRSRGGIAREDKVFYISAALVLCAVLITPHGPKLLPVPFVSTEFASAYIAELKTIHARDLLSFQMVLGIPVGATLLVGLLALTAVSLISSLVGRDIRIGHLIMCLSGVLLLVKGSRFAYEFSLLALPVLVANPPQKALFQPDRWQKVLGFLAFCFLVFVPFIALKQQFVNLPKYPLSPKNLPVGVVKFLNDKASGGNILNHPNDGGYLQWMVYPKYRIFMDMEVPFLFTDMDFFVAHNVFGDETLLNAIIGRYRPSFIVAPIDRDGFGKLMGKMRSYVPVFFDDTAVLYMNRAADMYTATEYELKALDPFQISGKALDMVLQKKDRELVKTELSRILRVYPGGLIGNQLMAEIYLDEKNYNEALSHANTIIAGFPESPVGYKVKGKALAGMKRPEEAVQYYRLAVERSTEQDKQDLYRRLAMIYLEQGEYGKAYEASRKGVDIFATNTNYVQLYQLGSTAFLSGRKKKAETILRFGYQKVPTDNAEWKENYKKLFSEMNIRIE